MQERVHANVFEAPKDNAAADPGWMLPVSILCTGFSSFLSIAPESVFYEQQQPISFQDLWSGEDRNNLLNLLTNSLWQVGVSRLAYIGYRPYLRQLS